MEIWKEIEGLQVSNLGNFKRKGVFLKQYEHRYLYVMILNGKIKSAHRLVAIAFIENLCEKPYVNHINGIKTDNRVSNLEWVTAKENNVHAIKTGLRVEPKGLNNKHYGKRGGETIRAKKVIDNLNGKIYNSLKDVVIDSLYSYKSLSKQLTGTIKNKTNFTYL